MFWWGGQHEWYSPWPRHTHDWTLFTSSIVRPMPCPFVKHGNPGYNVGYLALRNTLGTIQKIYNFLEASPKCHAVLHSINHEGTSLELTLKSQSITRWSCRLSRLLWNSFLVKALLLLAEEKDLKTSVESKCLLTAICDFDFEVLKIILSNTDSLSK